MAVAVPPTVDAGCRDGRGLGVGRELDLDVVLVGRDLALPAVTTAGRLRNVERDRSLVASLAMRGYLDLRLVARLERDDRRARPSDRTADPAPARAAERPRKFLALVFRLGARAVRSILPAASWRSDRARTTSPSFPCRSAATVFGAGIVGGKPVGGVSVISSSKPASRVAVMMTFALPPGTPSGGIHLDRQR